jgi:low affinity Fe/Cu permease
MKLVLILLAVVAVAYVVGRVLIKRGKLADEDGNNIPDVIDERVRRVKEEAADVAKATKTVAKQVKDVADAAAGKPRRGRKPAAKKADPDGEKSTVTAADKAAAAKAVAKESPKRKPRRKTAAKPKADPTPRKTTKRPSKKDA